MINRILKYSLIVLVSISAVLIWYLNSLKRVEYEHSINLPSNVKILSIDSEWWKLKSNITERHLKCILSLPINEFNTVIKNGTWRAYMLENNSFKLDETHGNTLYISRSYYSLDNKNKNVRKWLKIVNINKDVIEFELLTTYS